MTKSKDEAVSPEQLTKLLGQRLGARGRTEEERLKSGRSRLPRRLRKSADTLLAAAEHARHRPDLPVLNRGALVQSRAEIGGYLEARDIKAERAEKWRKWVSGLTVNLALLAGLIAGFYLIGTSVE